MNTAQGGAAAIALCVAATGCGGTTVPAPNENGPRAVEVIDVGASRPRATPRAAPQRAPQRPLPPYVVGTPYEKLFDPRQSWTFRVLRIDEHDDGTGRNRRSTSTERVRCRVERVVVEPWGATATIQCDEPPDVGVSSPLTGVWLATPSGLHRFGPGSSPRLADAQAWSRTLPNPLAASKARDAETGTEVVVEHVERAWCWKSLATAGDLTWLSICFEHAEGFVSANRGRSDARFHDVTFDLARR